MTTTKSMMQAAHNRAVTHTTNAELLRRSAEETGVMEFKAAYIVANAIYELAATLALNHKELLAALELHAVNSRPERRS